MNKYNEVEIQTAKNLLKQGYKWIAREDFGEIYAYADKPRKNYDKDYSDDTWQCDGDDCLICTVNVSIFQGVTCDDKEPTSLESIIHPQILDDAERQYLSAVIKPFRDKVDFICKENFMGYGCEHIVIGLIGAGPDMALPLFKSGAMYKGMELGYDYTLEELWL